MRLGPPGFTHKPDTPAAPQVSAKGTGLSGGARSSGGVSGPGSSKNAPPGKQTLPPEAGTQSGKTDPSRVRHNREIPVPDPGALIRTLGLPADKLSAVLLSFARYFSLPLKPALMTRLRREALSVPAGNRESAALGAAAAAGKGVRLSAETLERYALAIEGGQGPEERIDENAAGESPERGGEQDTERSGTGGGQGGQGGEEREPEEASGESGQGGKIRRGTFALRARRIRKKIAAVEANRPFLSLLNMIPGKNGRRWAVFPFDWSSGGVEFKVSVRILLHDRINGAAAERLAVDCTAETRRWLFVLDKPGEADSRADLYVRPPPEKPVPEAEIRELLGDFVRRWVVHPGEMPPFADSEDDSLFSVNEEV